jgi:glucuronoarabinoxylan endo-1,4-beta-xylanase
MALRRAPLSFSSLARGSLCAGLLALALVSVPARAATVQIDRAHKQQTIEGFGFFGAYDNYWGDGDLADEDWVRLVIDDLGLSMWRNEYYPPDDDAPQDADWDEQEPVVEALRDQARKSGVPLRTIVTVWSPPAVMKCASDQEAVHEGIPHPGGTRGGGAVCASQRARFAAWLIEGLKQYAELGVPVYGLSIQNEPLFAQGFNSGVYPPVAYAETLAAVGPLLHARFPRLKLFGSENLLEIETGKEGGQFDPYWYTAKILANPRALAQLGAIAVHLFGVTPPERAAEAWQRFTAATAPAARPTWMTETSSYLDAWEGGRNDKGEERPGAFALARNIHAALYHGKVSAWLWWQGSELQGPNEFSLMQGLSVGKRYHASKHFYRFLRPGARMVATRSDDPEVQAAAFEHARLDNFVTILINTAYAPKAVRLEGKDLPFAFASYVTDVHASLGAEPAVVWRDRIVLPPRSVTTLLNGTYLDRPRKPAPNEYAGRRH